MSRRARPRCRSGPLPEQGWRPRRAATDARLAAVEAELLAGLNGAAEVAAVHRVLARSGEIVEWPTPIDARLQQALTEARDIAAVRASGGGDRRGDAGS
jgi:hypothetical protein